jgi:hypothetical protein
MTESDRDQPVPDFSDPLRQMLAFEPYYNAIGKVAAAYSELEFSMNDAIWELANVARSAGVCMTAQMIGPGPRIRCLLALLKFRSAPKGLIDEFNRIGEDIVGVAASRNRHLHDPISLDTESGQIQRMEATADRQVRFKFIATEIDELTKLTKSIYKVTDDFDSLYLRACAELPSWPRTQFEQSEGIAVHRTDQKTDATGPTPPPVGG